MAKRMVAWKQVTLEYDRQTHDRRGRLLAYVYVDGKLLQEELLRNGHAFAESFPPNVKHREKFLQLQQEAMAAKKGMWGLNPKDYPQENKIDEYLIEGVGVKRVLNGDSIELEDGAVVRLIGIDAPDSENRFVKGQVGNAAYEAHKALLEGKTVNIEYDVEAKDPRGRELAWVFVGNELINAALVREGHAIVAVFPPNVKYLEVLFKAQAEAAKAKKGLWSGEEQ
jgi:micrococcal nuclease